ncbi:MAG: protease inhibitor I42 family protein [Armatimonadetes bacterium]|nr:protease inhibitor I42 family protein [Armatimonadota bacterium]
MSKRVNPYWVSATVALVIVTVAAFPVACRQAKSAAKGPTEGRVEVTTVFSQSDTSAIPIAAEAGSRFTIKLEANHTTGYRWQLTGTPYAKVVKLVGSTYNESASGLAGRGGTEVWTFNAIGKGTATITLNYTRPWEKNVKPAKVQRFEVAVR